MGTARLDMALAVAPHAELLLAADGSVICASEQYCRSAHTTIEKVESATIFELPPCSDSPVVATSFRLLLSRSIETAARQSAALRDEANKMWSAVSFSPLRNDASLLRATERDTTLTLVLCRLEPATIGDPGEPARGSRLRQPVVPDESVATRLSSAMGAANALAWELEIESGTLTYLGDFCAFYGLSSPLEDPRHPDDRAPISYAVEAAIASESQLEVEFRGPDRGRRTRRYLSRGRVRRDCPDGRARLAGVTWDITEQRRLVDERISLEQAIQEGQKLESLGVFAGGIAHDFNNLLTTVLGNASLLQLELESHAALELVDEVEAASRRASALCQQLLAYAGRGKFALRPIDMNAVLREITSLLKFSVGARVELRCQFAKQLPSVLADAAQIRQILMNLVLNASEAIGEREGTIVIETGVCGAEESYRDGLSMDFSVEPTDWVYVDVSDTGEGMSDEIRARIFEPFFTTRFVGRGLGLPAVLGIARGHGGALRVRSRAGDGSSFRLLLPEASRTVELPNKISGVRPIPADNPAILVVDDEDSVRTLVCRLVKKLGYRPLAAGDGEEALRLYQAHRDELVGVVLDLTMPAMNGEETYRELRRVDPEARVLLMSGYSEQEAVSHFAGAGLVGFLQKPFGFKELSAKVGVLTK